jgi:hypothetical protein
MQKLCWKYWHHIQNLVTKVNRHSWYQVSFNSFPHKWMYKCRISCKRPQLAIPEEFQCFRQFPVIKQQYCNQLYMLYCHQIWVPNFWTIHFYSKHVSHCGVLFFLPNTVGDLKDFMFQFFSLKEIPTCGEQLRTIQPQMIHLVSTMKKYGNVCAKCRIMQYTTLWFIWQSRSRYRWRRIIRC